MEGKKYFSLTLSEFFAKENVAKFLAFHTKFRKFSNFLKRCIKKLFSGIPVPASQPGPCILLFCLTGRQEVLGPAGQIDPAPSPLRRVPSPYTYRRAPAPPQRTPRRGRRNYERKKFNF